MTSLPSQVSTDETGKNKQKAPSNGYNLALYYYGPIILKGAKSRYKQIIIPTRRLDR